MSILRSYVAAFMPMDRIVVRYHEVALKKTNRVEFVALLTRNIVRMLEGTGVVDNHRAPGRIIFELPSTDRWPEVRSRLRRVFGVANFLLCEAVSGDIPELAETVAGAAEREHFHSFAIRTRRSDKTFHLASPEVSARIGEAVQRRTGKRVDLERPDLEIHIEILPRETLYSLEKVSGAGGLPTDASGNVLALLSGGIDSPVAAHRLMQRGCRVEMVHFHAVPYQSRAGLEKAVDLAEILGAWQHDSRLHAIAFGDVQKEIVAQAPRRARIVLYRRMMMRIAERLAASIGAQALVTGDSLGQVASQTLTNLATVQECCTLPVLRPLIGMDKDEITAYSRKIGAYETSIRPEEDCCQLYIPKHPSTRLQIGPARGAEEPLDIEGLVSRALETLETFAA